MVNEGKKRLFFAIPAKDKYGELLDTLIKDNGKPDGVKWVKPENLHITVLFLGSVSTNKIEEIIEAAEKVATNSPPFVLTPDGFTLMPSENKPKMAWIRFKDNEAFTTLHQTLKEALKDCFDGTEEKKPLPHITLARFKNGETIRKPEEIDSETLITTAIELWESETRQEGPIYKPIKTFSLK
jgi:RNA 2',3'-cyclic 3'-phosphodiesterase